MLLAGNAVAGGDRDAKHRPSTCKDQLDNNSYRCLAVSEEGEYFPMRLDFSGSEGNLFVRVDEFVRGACSCKAKNPNVFKPLKIKFDSDAEFHCVTSGGVDSTFPGTVSGTDFGGPEIGGPETFTIESSRCTRERP